MNAIVEVYGWCKEFDVDCLMLKKGYIEIDFPPSPDVVPINRDPLPCSENLSFQIVRAYYTGAMRNGKYLFQI